MRKTKCFETLAALALALGAPPPTAAGEVILDDFTKDPNFADGEPLTWKIHLDCCAAQVEEEPGAGIRVAAMQGENAGVIMTERVFSGDVTALTQSTVGRRSDVLLHLDPLALTGYSAFVCSRNCTEGQYRVGLIRWDGYDPPLQLERTADFDPTEGDVFLELSSQGAYVECRVWPEGSERADRPSYRIQDGRYRAGSVGFGADPQEPVVLRWVQITLPGLDSAPFRRGDVNADGKVDISDGIDVLGHLFLGTSAPGCRDAADADDSSALEITDAIYLFNFLFLGHNAPPAPGPSACGEDPTEDAFDSCEISPACA